VLFATASEWVDRLATAHHTRAGRAELRLADERAMNRGDVATLTPPADIHNHPHVPGSGPSPYSLILLDDDMYATGRRADGGRESPVVGDAPAHQSGRG
jgi:hypothetical protein